MTTFFRLLKNNNLNFNIVVFICFSIVVFYNKAFANNFSCIENECNETRIIKVLLLYDDKKVNTKKWIDNINIRLEEINKFYYSNYKIRWKITKKQLFPFNKELKNLSSLFTLHKEEIINLSNNNDEEIILCILSRSIRGKGIAATFSNIAMVADSHSFKNYESSVILAHELAHLFGAWHTQRKNDFMLASGADQLRVSNESNSILNLMRNYNFDTNLLVNENKILKRISRLYNRHHARGEINPVSRLLTDIGASLYIKKEYNKSIQLLNKSNKFYGRWGKTRMLLSKNYYETGLYNKSFLELTRAVFFGAVPDLKFENKLRQKFIDLKKIDSNINNPFVSN